MNTKSAKKIMQEHGLILLRWNGSFTEAIVRNNAGVTKIIHTDGGRQKLLQRLKLFESFPTI